MDLRSGARDYPFSQPDFFDLRNGTRNVFDDIGAVFTFRVTLPREDGSPERLYKAQVSTNFFRLMGAKVAFGRDFQDADGRPTANRQKEEGLPIERVAILSYEYWKHRYSGNAAVIGTEMLSFGQRGPRIVGVLAPGFKLFFPASAATETAPDVWIANDLGYDSAERGIISLRLIARLIRMESPSSKRRSKSTWLQRTYERPWRCIARPVCKSGSSRCGSISWRQYGRRSLR